MAKTYIAHPLKCGVALRGEQNWRGMKKSFDRTKLDNYPRKEAA